MRLFVAEKPSLARAIAEALPGPRQRARTHITCGDGNVVAWCAGHILETAPPEAYGSHYKQWRLGDLPITPREWKLEVSIPELLRAIQTLLRDATRVVHAGDPDREGQLLVDEVLHFLGYKGPVDRLLIRDVRPEAVSQQLRALEPNAKYRSLYESALARQRADWLYGMNMTRLYTLLGRAAGYDGVLSVGRVQTPLLGLIVARDRAIAQFHSVPYYVPSATVRAGGGETFRALWAPGPGVQAHLDDEKRLLHRDVAEGVRARVEAKTGTVVAYTQDKKSEAPPLPHSLADLQVDAGKRLGMTAQAVLDACQSLYETHRLTTYPRSDCSHLPEAHFAQAHGVVRAIAEHAPTLAAATERADLSFRSKAWNDTKVTAHHAIILTPSAGAPGAPLSDRERAVYELVCRRYLAQFYPAHQFLHTKVELEIAGERFTATGRMLLASGWKALAPDVSHDVAGGGGDTGERQPETDDTAVLPRLAPGDAITAGAVALTDKKTQPPKPFTDASLIAAMCAIAKFVSDARVKKILTESDGIGTPATRAAIIETLFARGYVTRVKSTILSTETGRALITSLPQVATTPDMTAVWEAAMRAITEGTQPLDAFLARVGAQLQDLVARGRALGRIDVPAACLPSPPRAPKLGRPSRPTRRSR